MKNEVQYDIGDYTVRWVSYLDILGFTELVGTKDWFEVFSCYNRAIEEFTKEYGITPNIEKTWFSDTFLLYSPDETKDSFDAIDYATRFFIYGLIEHSIPVCGAMSCCDFYADRENNIFFGPALIEAYHYGENQHWIGFVLTPSAVKQMDAIGLDASKKFYAYWDIPYKTADYRASARKDALNLQKSLPAYIIGGHLEIDGRNLCLDKLCKMKGKLKDDRLIEKYENTINFIVNKQKDIC